MSVNRDDLNDLPAVDPQSLVSEGKLGARVRIFAKRVQVGAGVVIGDDVVLVGDDISVGDNTIIGSGCDIRASTVAIGAGSELQQGVKILVAEMFSVGVAARIANGVSIVCRDFRAGRLLYLGDRLSVGYGGTSSSTSTMRVGNRVTIGQHTILNANLPIEIGDDVGTGSYLAIWTHGYHFGHGPMDGYSPAYAPVRVEKNVWLGFHVTILPGVTIGENSIVAAGSMVTTPMPANSLIGGVPASVRKTLAAKPADENRAREAAREVLQVWLRELEWKGCRVISSQLEPGQSEVVVSLEDGSERTRVVVLGAHESAPSPAAGEALVLLITEDRADLEALGSGSAALLELRTGRWWGGVRAALLEDLRDQFRRYGMPCGDDRTFSAIEPVRFKRLRDASNRA